MAIQDWMPRESIPHLTMDQWCSPEEAEAVKELIGYMSQRFGLYPDLTVDENIHFYADLYGMTRKARAGRMDELLDFSNMRPFRKRLAGNLSGGMKQKLALACTLIHSPRALLLDEPTTGVDPVCGMQVEIAGAVDDTQGPVTDIAADPTYLDVTVPPQALFTQPIPRGHTAFAYPFEGAGHFAPTAPSATPSPNLVIYGDGDRVEVQP